MIVMRRAIEAGHTETNGRDDRRQLATSAVCPCVRLNGESVGSVTMGWSQSVCEGKYFSPTEHWCI